MEKKYVYLLYRWDEPILRPKLIGVYDELAGKTALEEVGKTVTADDEITYQLEEVPLNEAITRFNIRVVDARDGIE